MAFLQKVTRGAPVRRNWIEENTVRELVTPGVGFGERPLPAREWRAWIVPGRNAAGGAMKRGQPVRIDAAQALTGDDVLPFAAPTAEMASGFAVLADDMAADGFGDAVISGAVWTTLTGSGAAAGDFVIPASSGANWWVKADAGAKVLWLSENGVGLILLGGAGGGGGGGGGYNGYFKAVLVTETENGQDVRKVKIVNGADPTATVCGQTDIGAVNAVELDLQNGNVYLTASYDSDTGRYSFAFSIANAPTDGTAWWQIAQINNGKLAQVWTGGTIYFGERFLI